MRIRGFAIKRYVTVTAECGVDSRGVIRHQGRLSSLANCTSVQQEVAVGSEKQA